MRKTRILLCIFLGILAGLSVSAYYLAHNARVQAAVTEFVFDQLGTILGCSCKARCISLNFITGRCTFEVVCEDPAHRWQVHSTSCTLAFSWLKLITHRAFYVTLTVDEVTSFSHVTDTGEPALAEPIRRWLALEENPIQATVTSIHVRHATGRFVHPGYQSEVSVRGAGDLYVGTDAVHITGAYSHGEVLLHNQSVLHDLAGSLHMAIAYKDLAVTADLHLAGVVAYLSQLRPHCQLAAVWSADKKELIMRAQEALVRIEYDHAAEQWCFSGMVPSTYGFDLLGLASPQQARGVVRFSGNAGKGMHATIQADDLMYAGYPLPRVQCTCTDRTAQVHAQYQEYAVVAEVGLARDRHMLTVSWHNTSSCEAPYIGCCVPNAMQGTLEYNYETGVGEGAYNIAGACHQIAGELILKPDFGEIAAHGPDGNCRMRLRKEFSWYVAEVLYRAGEAALMSVQGAADGSYRATVDYEFVKRWARSIYGLDLVGEGKLQSEGHASWHGVDAHIHLDKGQIHIPLTYNVLERLEAYLNLDRALRTLTVRQAQLGLAQGTIDLPEMLVRYDNTYMPAYVHAPLLIKNCFVHWKKDIVGELSGFLVARYGQHSGSSLIGQVVFDKAYVQSNILSVDFKKQFMSTVVSPFSFSYDATLDVTVATRRAIAVKTPFLETECTIQLGVTGTLSDPHVVGSLELTKGVLQFPYEPLYVTVGRLYFLPNQLDDPLIELTAKNTIKKYAITMNVTGSLSHPRISFDASPTLSQGQIITLLLGGADNGSLYLAMPAALTTNLENLLFGPAETSSIVKRSIRTLFRPLRHVRLVPSFSDEYGRGGLRGSLVIDVSDRLKATIQQNFTLTEDTRYDLEFALSDTMSIHMVKDERRDLGAEFEKVWKFS